MIQLIKKFFNQLNIFKMAETQEFNSGFGKAGCHIENVGELLQAFDAQFVDAEGKVVKLDGSDVLKLISMLYGKFEETLLECEGKTIEIEFGDSATANLAETMVKFILQLANDQRGNV